MASKQEKTVEFYTQVVGDVGFFDADNEGFLSVTVDGKVIPVTISKKRLCLPTAKLLQENDWTKRIAFSPLAEQINQGPSPVLNAFKQYIYVRLDATLKAIIESLAPLAEDTRRHKGLSEKASVYLALMAGFDQKTVDTVKKILAKVSDTPENRLVSMFLKNGGKNGVLRTCNVSFPVMDDAHSEDRTTFFGVKMPRKTSDKTLIVQLFEYVLGDKDVRETYSQGSTDGEAPYFHSLLLAFHKIAKRLNDLIEIHSPACPELTGFAFGLEWSNTLDNFSEFARTNAVGIPSLPGNRGQEKDAAEAKSQVSGYDVSDEDIGNVDLPWDETDEERERRGVRVDRSRRSTSAIGRALSGDRDEDDRDSRRGRDDRDDRSRDRDERPRGRRDEPAVRTISIRELTSGRSRDNERDNDRDSRSSRRDRDDGRDYRRRR